MDLDKYNERFRVAEIVLVWQKQADLHSQSMEDFIEDCEYFYQWLTNQVEFSTEDEEESTPEPAEEGEYWYYRMAGEDPSIYVYRVRAGDFSNIEIRDVEDRKDGWDRSSWSGTDLRSFNEDGTYFTSVRKPEGVVW